jgi:restriction endonuclease S subunit
VGLVQKLPVPIPPPGEQRLIVAKVDEVVALCDDLEARIQRARDTRSLRHLSRRKPGPRGVGPNHVVDGIS